LLDRLADGRVLLTDGATGTNFQQMGLPPGVAPEDWVFDVPDRVRELHARFVRAGSEFALTCSFGANSARLADGPLSGRVRELNIRAAELAREVGVAAIGANCGRSLEDNDTVVHEFLQATTVPVWIKPNAGVPQVVGDSVVYEADPATLAAHIADYARQGARIVGGCCGTTPEHIAAIAHALGR